MDLPQSRRDGASIWIARHRWVVPIMRVVAGLALVGVVALVFDTDLPYDKLVAFVIGAALAGTAGNHERERGDTLLDAAFVFDDDPAPPDLPKEFAGYVHRPPDPRSPGRHYRPR